MSEWFLTRLGAGTVGPFATDSVLEGIADGRVPRDTTARAVGERDARALVEIPVFEAAVRVARPLEPPPVPFEGLVEAERDRRAELREERARQRRRTIGARFERMTAPLRQRDAVWLLTGGALIGGVIGAAFTVLALPRERAELLGVAPAGRSIEGAALRAATRALSTPATTAPPSPAAIVAPALDPVTTEAPSADPAPARPSRSSSPAAPSSFSIDPLNAPLTPPLGPPRTP